MSSAFLGKVIDNYRIIENLGVGGMGMVFKAIHIKLDKFFALKLIAPGLIMNENFIERFQSEAKALAKFEEGVNLSKLCSAKLDEIEKKITLLMQDGDGRISEHPFTERNKGKTDLDV